TPSAGTCRPPWRFAGRSFRAPGTISPERSSWRRTIPTCCCSPAISPASAARRKRRAASTCARSGSRPIRRPASGPRPPLPRTAARTGNRTSPEPKRISRTREEGPRGLRTSPLGAGGFAPAPVLPSAAEQVPQFHREGEDDGRALLPRQYVEGRKVAQLHRLGRLAEDPCGLQQGV